MSDEIEKISGIKRDKELKRINEDYDGLIYKIRKKENLKSKNHNSKPFNQVLKEQGKTDKQPEPEQKPHAKYKNGKRI